MDSNQVDSLITKTKFKGTIKVLEPESAVEFIIRTKYSYGLTWYRIEAITGETLRPYFRISDFEFHSWLTRLELLQVGD